MQTDELEKYFKRMYKDSSLWVYTTGLDYEQMVDYTNRALACGITKFEFTFEVDTDTNRKFVKDMKSNDNVTEFNYKFQ